MRAAISALAFLAGVSPAIAGKGWERPEGSWGRHGKPGGHWGASPASTAATGTGSGASSSIPSGWNATSSSSSLSKSSSPVTSETVIVSPIGGGNGGLQQPATVTVTAVVTSVVTSVNSICALPSSSLGGAGGIGGYGSWSPSQSGAAGSNAGSGSNNGESTNGASIVNAAFNNNAYSNGGAATTAQATQTFVPVPYGDYTPSGWGTQAWGPSTVTYISSVETTITSVLTQLTTKMQGGSTTTSTQYSTITLTSTIPVTVTSTTTYTSIPTTLSIEQPTGPIGPVTISFSSTPSASSSKGGNVGNGGNGGYGGSSWTGSGSASVSSGSASTGPASIGPVSTDTTSTGIVSSGTISSSASTSSAPASPTWPACWTACWAQYNVTSLRLACSNSLSKACINSTCSAADASQYAAWVSSGCPALNTTSSISSTASATGTISGPVSGSTSSIVSGPVSGSTSSTIGVNGTSSSSSLSQTSYTTYTTTCSENGTTTIHTHSQVVSPTTYPAANTTTAGPTGATSSSTVSTSSYPAGNSTTVGPTGSGSTSFPATSYTTFVTTCTENGTTTLHTHSQVVSPTTYPAGNTTTAGPSGSGSTSLPATSYTTFVTTCTENGTTTLHTHSQVVSPTTYPAGNTTTASPTGGATASTSPYPAGNSSTVGPTGTGSATWPTHTECVPCEGQPGSDPDKFCGYTIKDNPYQVTPKTCRTKVFHFDIQNVTIAPDGVERIALAVNGQVPGPLVEAYWGDQIVVHVKNSMQNNGSTIHWHGQRQNYTNDQDGVASITQCPIAPGETYTYTFTANNFGYSWYHAHYILQAYEGVYGPMLIHGPKSVEGNYDEVPIAINDWSHVPVSEMYDAAQAVGPRPATGPRTMDTSLINGVNVWQDGGKRWELDVVKGETKILHFLNAAIQSTYVFYIDGHSFQVIANDYVPIIPYTTNHVVFNPGQRYSILITFDQAVDNYWLRADNQNSCSNTTDWDNIKAIIRYKGASKTDPTSTAVSYTPGCGDESLANLVPAYEMTVGVTHAAPIAETVLIAGNGGSPNVYKWTLNGVTFDSEWGSPSLLSIYENGTVPSYSGPLAVEVPNLHEWVYFIIQSPIPFPHPIHLHGHDFFVLAQGTGMYANTTLNLENPPRRDTAMMPWDPVAGLGGHLVLAFETDNPGAWLMHCHIGWHNSMGFAIQIIEAKSQIAGTISDKWGKQLQDTCSAYNSWANTYDIKTDDSGV